MSLEQQPRPHEQLSEHQADLDRLARQRLEELKSEREIGSETDSADRRAEAAREVINQHKAERPTEAPPPDPAETSPAEPKAANRLNVLPPALNYQHTLMSLQQHLKPASRAFSRVIHQPAVEAASEALGKTVARPSVINGALWTALIIGTVFYLTARTFGYRLSGSEMLFALLGGAIIGIVAEAVWRAFKRQ
ncbi:MAG TPA: hypothetical protein VI322_04860 [Candidatus Saccharimonadia bacterium]